MGNCLRVSNVNHNSIEEDTNLNTGLKYGRSEDLNTDEYQDCFMEFPEGGDVNNDPRFHSAEWARESETQTVQFDNMDDRFKSPGNPMHQNYPYGHETSYNKPPCKPGGDYYPDNETSSFAETWDPALFDCPPNQQYHHHYHNYRSPNSAQHFHRLDEFSHRRRNHARYGPKKQYRDNRFNMQSWSSNESFIACTPTTSRYPVVSTSVLGFSALTPNFEETTEWYRNGELEAPNLNSNNYLIKTKQLQQQQQTLSHSSLVSNMNTPTSLPNSVKILETSIKSNNHDGWLRYTMFLPQGDADDVDFITTIRKARHTLMSLENKTGCEIRISKRLFIHRGKPVRTVVIDGPSRKHIVRCYSSLPDVLSRFLILECERPSIYDTKSDRKPSELASLSQVVPSTIFPNTAVAV